MHGEIHGKILHSELTGAIIGAAVEVHRTLGPGLLESAYKKCFARELIELGISFRREVPLPLVYKGAVIENEESYAESSEEMSSTEPAVITTEARSPPEDHESSAESTVGVITTEARRARRNSRRNSLWGGAESS